MKKVTGVPESVTVDGQTVRFVWRGVQEYLASGDGESVEVTLSKFDFVRMIEQLMDAVKEAPSP